MIDKETVRNAVSREEMINEFYQRHPRLVRMVKSFTDKPFSGEPIKIAFGMKSSQIDREEKLKALETPSMWNDEAPIVITQYCSYASPEVTSFWNTTLTELNDKYAPVVRYEHYDIPVPEHRLLEYRLATIGRCIQHYDGNEGFWTWFNSVMVEGVKTTEEAYELVERSDVDVDHETVKESVEYDLYENVIWNDISSLLSKGGAEQSDMIESQLKQSKPVFELFVNGERVRPSYDEIVLKIESALPEQANAKG
jgi:hypothetical protein